jgi:ABC-type Na+ transport system ATPase subunit NatA
MKLTQKQKTEYFRTLQRLSWNKQKKTRTKADFQRMQALSMVARRNKKISTGGH